MPRIQVLLTAFLLATPALPDAAARDSYCADRPLEQPHVLSNKGQEPHLVELIWGTGRHYLRYRVAAPALAAYFGSCLAKARAEHGDAWEAVATLSMEVEREPRDGHWQVQVGFGEAELRLSTSVYETLPWEMIEQIHAWILERPQAARPAGLEDALWTLWVEAYLAALPDDARGYDLAGYSSYMYADEVDEVLSDPRDGRWHRPGFTPLMVGGRLMVGGVFDQRLHQAGVEEGQWVTRWMERPVEKWDRNELFDWWVREEPFEYTFEITGRQGAIRLGSSSYETWDLAIGYLPEIAYVRIANFTPVVVERMREAALPPIVEHKLRGLILDLRSNPGGRDEIGILDLFFPPGETTATWMRIGPFTVQSHSGEGEAYYDVPLVVLIDGDTGSMAEIFVAAVRQNGRGVLVGKKTWGKGLAQGLYAVGGEGILKLIRDLHYYPGTRQTWHGKGIAPDIEMAPGPRAEEVAATLRRPLADLEHLYEIDPVFRKAVDLLKGHDPEHQRWSHLLKPYEPKVARQR